MDGYRGGSAPASMGSFGPGGVSEWATEHSCENLNCECDVAPTQRSPNGAARNGRYVQHSYLGASYSSIDSHVYRWDVDGSLRWTIALAESTWLEPGEVTVIQGRLRPTGKLTAAIV